MMLTVLTGCISNQQLQFLNEAGKLEKTKKKGGEGGSESKYGENFMFRISG